ncbi:MAG: putative lipid II flippase FtsW [Desulfobacteraceae bacterium]|nr:MAG: putative lipid II flippase FtsW [Desulfobacteraceae bacterium]
MKQTNQKAASLSYDVTVMLPVLLLTGIGIAMVYSASSAIALQNYEDEYYFFTRQLISAGIGFLAFLIGRYIPYQMYRRTSYLLFAGSMALLVVVLLEGMGREVKGSVRWIDFLYFRFQPVELARFALIVFMGYSIAKKQDRIESFAIGFMPHVVVLMIFSILILLQPDYGSVVIFWAMGWLLMFAGRVSLRQLVTTALLVVLPAAIFLIFSSSYRLKRVLSFWDPWQYPKAEGYQVIHSLMGFGSGGLWGKGFGQGYQKLFYLPDPHTDFIFSVIGEEGGLRWVLIVIGLYLIVLWRGLTIAKMERDFFGSLLALGITVSITLQAVINMAVNLSLLPTKGLTLPFLSYGGSSLVINLGLIGVLMNIWASQKR